MCLLCCGRERDEFDAELTELKKKLAYVETAHESSTHERDDLRTEVSAVLECVPGKYTLCVAMLVVLVYAINDAVASMKVVTLELDVLFACVSLHCTLLSRVHLPTFIMHTDALSCHHMTLPITRWRRVSRRSTC